MGLELNYKILISKSHLEHKKRGIKKKPNRTFGITISRALGERKNWKRAAKKKEKKLDRWMVEVGETCKSGVLWVRKGESWRECMDSGVRWDETAEEGDEILRKEGKLPEKRGGAVME